MTEILAGMFTKLSTEEIDKACYLCLGQLAPKYEGKEFNMAEKMMLRSLGIAFDGSPEVTKKIYKETGDLGETALKLKERKGGGKEEIPKLKISIFEVYDRLLKVAEDEGEGSVERKVNKMAKLLKELDSLSAKYVARIPVNKLRLGFSHMTILDSLSWMAVGDKSLRTQLERAFNVLADIGKIARIFKKEGLKGIQRIESEVGVPIRAALAERLPDAKKILEKMEGQCVLEPKYDGFRCQIHIDENKEQKIKSQGEDLNLFGNDTKKYFVRIFSRNLDNTTNMFPDIIEAVQDLKVKSAILDGEAIGFNPKTGKFLAFQETVQRKRKHGVAKKAKELPLKVFVFDLLYLNGESLLTKPFFERRKLLEKILSENTKGEKGIILTQQKIVSKTTEFDDFFRQVVGEELEGLMAKKLNAVYQAGGRNFNWVKYKIGMKSELIDTVDCLVMGYYRGKGKRAGFGIGAFLVGLVLPLREKFRIKNLPAYRRDRELRTKIKNLELKKEFVFLTVSKIGTGLTDEQWQEIYKRCEKLKVSKRPEEYIVDKNLNPDVWCQQGLVVEIEADSITRSPIHSAGLAFRFPRLKRFRDDKKSHQTTSLKELKDLSKNPEM